MAFYIYRNHRNNRLVIHRGECGHCNEGNGVQQNPLGDQNGHWYLGPNNGYQTYQASSNAAVQIALEMGVQYQNCRRCNPDPH